VPDRKGSAGRRIPNAGPAAGVRSTADVVRPLDRLPQRFNAASLSTIVAVVLALTSALAIGAGSLFGPQTVLPSLPPALELVGGPSGPPLDAFPPPGAPSGAVPAP
jgi:hypothetical protein